MNTNNSISIFDLLSYNEKTLFSIKIVDNINIGKLSINYRV